jgi:hypothetical protein
MASISPFVTILKCSVGSLEEAAPTTVTAAGEQEEEEDFLPFVFAFVDIYSSLVQSVPVRWAL